MFLFIEDTSIYYADIKKSPRYMCGKNYPHTAKVDTTIAKTVRVLPLTRFVCVFQYVKFISRAATVE